MSGKSRSTPGSKHKYRLEEARKVFTDFSNEMKRVAQVLKQYGVQPGPTTRL